MAGQNSEINPDFQAFITNAMNQQAQQLSQMQQALAEKDQTIQTLLSTISNLELTDQRNKTPAASTSKNPPAQKRLPVDKGKQVLKSVSGPSQPKTPAATRKGKANTSTPVNRKKRESTPQSSTPKKPNQVMLCDLPRDFNKTKLAFYAHIKILWGMIEPHPIPPAPQPEFLQEFYRRFSNAEQLENVASDTSSANIVPCTEIQTLKGAIVGRKKVGQGIVNMEETFIHYAQSCLARMGLRVWCPNLEETPDSLLNSACRISAISTFRQIAAAEAYAYMNINKAYLQDFDLLIKCYNHFVHYRMLNRYKKELNEKGACHREEEKKAIHKGRERLREARYKFAVEQSFPLRYQKILNDISSHSDDEYDPKKRIYKIKTLPFRSAGANKFFRRLDDVMISTYQAQGRRFNLRKRIGPIPAEPTIYPKPPKMLPLDFYDPDWFNSLQPRVKDVTADIDNVAFLPNPDQSLQGKRNPDEKLSDKKFSAKYWDQLTERYDLDFVVEDNDTDGSDDEDESVAGSSGETINSGDTSAEEQEVDCANQDNENSVSDYGHEGGSGYDMQAYQGNNKMLIDDEGGDVFSNEWR